jgi:hypothetical protein
MTEIEIEHQGKKKRRRRRTEIEHQGKKKRRRRRKHIVVQIEYLMMAPYVGENRTP